MPKAQCLMPNCVHLTSQYPPVGKGGLGTHVRDLTQALDEHLPVEVISPALIPGNPLERETALHWGLSITSPRLIHAHNYEVALPALIAKTLTGVPLVVTLHLPSPEPYRALERHLLEAADAVIAVSRSLAQEYLQRGWRIPAPVVIPNGVDTGFYHPEPHAHRTAERLLFAGRLSPQKGCDLAVRALRELLPTFPGLTLHVAGAGPWDQAYRNLARRLGCVDRVRWLGWLDPVQLRQEYWRCGLFLMPSRFEPFGLSALEAMACGAPVVAAATGGLPEFITDQENGFLVSPANPAVLAEAVRALLVDPTEAARLGASAAARAHAFTWERAAQETLRVYQTLPQQSTTLHLTPECRLARAKGVIHAALGAEAVLP